MAVHRSNVDVQQWGCAVLGRLAPFTTDDVGELLRNATAGAVEAVVASLRAHVFSTEVQEAGCTALTKLTFKSSENRAKAVAVGAVEVVGATMRVHANNPSIQEQAWFLLGSLAEAAEVRPAAPPRVRTLLALPSRASGVGALPTVRCETKKPHWRVPLSGGEACEGGAEDVHRGPEGGALGALEPAAAWSTTGLKGNNNGPSSHRRPAPDGSSCEPPRCCFRIL